jgi:hypothetical protein
LDRKDFSFLLKKVSSQYYQSSDIDLFVEDLFAALIDVTLLKGEVTEYHELLDMQFFVIIMLLLLKFDMSQGKERERIFYGIIGDFEKGDFFLLERALVSIIYYLSDMSHPRALVKARSIIRVFEETYLDNIQEYNKQEKKKNDPKYVKNMQQELYANLDRKFILKKILIQTPYIPAAYKSYFLDLLDNTAVNPYLDDNLQDNTDMPSNQKYDFRPKTRPFPRYSLEDYAFKPLSAKHRKRQRRYPKLDVYSMNTIQEDEVNLETLAKRLTGLARTDEEKTRVFFKWVTFNIDFDPSVSAVDSQSVFATRKANSEGFARLFAALCELGSVQVEVIKGQTRDTSLQCTNNHYWNSVTIDNQKYFVDCALASGVFDGEKHTKQLRDYYFLVPPDSFIDNHFPEDSSKQYLKALISLNDYISRNELLYQGSVFGLTMNSFSLKIPEIELKNANTVRLKFVGDNIEYKVVLRDCETGEEACSGTVELVNEKKRKLKLRARIPESQPKKYIMELLGREKKVEAADEEDEEEEEVQNKQMTNEPEFSLLIKWTVSKIIEKKEKHQEAMEGEEDNNANEKENEEQEQEEE